MNRFSTARPLAFVLAAVLPFLPARGGADSLPVPAEFAGFHRIDQPPYQVLTDEPGADLNRVLQVLTALRQQFGRQFGSLLPERVPARTIQVVLFRREDDFRRYARQVTPAFEQSAGFYAAQVNRLVLLADARALTSPPVSRRPAAPRAELAAPPLWPAWNTAGGAPTEFILRHEGAHQLFAHYGIHSPYALEPTWITEGLAEYCVPAEIGRFHAAHARLLKQRRAEGRLLPLETLLNHRDPAGFFAFDDEQAETAYAQSWALTWVLMQPPHRERFFSLLRFYRDTDARSARAVEDHEPAALLYTQLALTQRELEIEWQRFLERL